MPSNMSLSGKSPQEKAVCKRRDILDKLHGVLTSMENPPFDVPRPKATVRAAMCECVPKGRPSKVSYRPTQCMDGSPGVPLEVTSESTRIQWTPKYPKITQNSHPGMICYGQPPVLDEDLCECPDSPEAASSSGKKSVMCCECPEADGAHRHKPPKGQEPSLDLTIKDHCTSGQEKIYCPMDPKHQHWSPYKGACEHPRPCHAQCFDHSTTRDYIKVIPDKC